MPGSAAGPYFESHARRIGSGQRTPGTDRRALRGVLRKIGRGLALLAGVMWLLVSMLLAGLVVCSSGWRGNPNETQFATGVHAGYVVFGCGVVLILLFVAAVVERRYGVAYMATLVPAVALSIAWNGPHIDDDFLGWVPTIGTAVTATVVTVIVTVSIGAALFLPRPGVQSGATRDAGGATSPAT